MNDFYKNFYAVIAPDSSRPPYAIRIEAETIDEALKKAPKLKEFDDGDFVAQIPSDYIFHDHDFPIYMDDSINCHIFHKTPFCQYWKRYCDGERITI